MRMSYIFVAIITVTIFYCVVTTYIYSSNDLSGGSRRASVLRLSNETVHNNAYLILYYGSDSTFLNDANDVTCRRILLVTGQFVV